MRPRRQSPSGRAAWRRDIRRIIARGVRWAFGDEQRLALYEWDFHRMPRARADDAVVEWRAPESLPPAVHEQLFGGGDRVFAWRQLALWRAGRIRCFSLLVDGHPAAFGVIREWRLHRREYAWLGRPGPILGPAWTDPEHRGKGLHRRLLLHRLHAAATSGAERAYTAAALGNLVSRRNVERLGFRPRGCVAIRRACFRLIVRVRPLDEPASVLPGAAGDARA